MENKTTVIDIKRTNDYVIYEATSYDFMEDKVVSSIRMVLLEDELITKFNMRSVLPDFYTPSIFAFLAELEKQEPTLHAMVKNDLRMMTI
ncbi:hypothetical protein [Bacillus phage vB_Bpu_PumA1]|uniref:Uncharacterized protein n=1 Tax=Bacillus phage vB_Bpu_PumA1 TaxID=2662127 RepID=A0A5Q2WDU9_9CAUD|nr:hypothetical protein H3020_gp25 [Bacillus phage vB_Bpu_PumA1]QGH74218.1 hypothetical protein [Bacillus phage vB_Bpu_PumA1]